MTQLGAIVGRFQTIDLHDGFRAFIESVLFAHEKTMVFIGSNPAALSRRDPLDFVSRKKMLEEIYGNQLIIKELHDCHDDLVWSFQLDKALENELAEGETATIFGDERTVVARYSGRFAAQKWEPKTWVETPAPPTATTSRDFRAGVFYAAFYRKYPAVFATVDIAILKNEGREVLLGRKANESDFRFPGGFSDPSDASFEAAVLREAREECGDVQLTDLTYLASFPIVEWRYRDSEDAVITHFFKANWVSGEPQASDDLAEIRWFVVADFDRERLVAEHRALFDFLRK